MANTRKQTQRWEKNQNWLLTSVNQLVTHDLHPDTIDRMNGLCFGMAAMAMQALLDNKLDLFHRRLSELHQLYADNKLTTASDDLQRFLSDALCYQSPHLFKNRFDAHTFLYQSVELVMPHAMPETLKEKGGIHCVKHFTGTYTLANLQQYFEKLRHAIDYPENASRPFALLLRGYHHSVTVGFNTNDTTWYLIDANHLPVQQFKTEAEIASAVHRAFGRETNTIFDTAVYSTKQRWKIPRTWHNQALPSAESARISNSKGVTWLMMAALTGDISNAEALLKQQTNVNAKLADGTTPLFLAVLRGQKRIVDLLLEYHAAPDVSLQNGETPLSVAVSHNLPGIVESLLERGADPNRVHRLSPLALAAKLGHLEVVSTLLEHGANRKWQTNDGKTALQLAKENGHTQIVKMLGWQLPFNVFKSRRAVASSQASAIGSAVKPRGE